ncbi:RagB/SusD family nutrient uptake outer membrane protein [Christiangramia echinicola]|uniref:Starch-binding associating with outer membrane n=1 Tax=Christiangramia echinicola TaxID=279359 RepID=A0A1H1MLJ3_9FLAO|nr:RagB/SusD family nutrient uptake outer membrane protein [Christiangramia echinicola]SDR87691.1 Starch-binding associating with outer membrane [Christiangramia echinicola]
MIDIVKIKNFVFAIFLLLGVTSCEEYLEDELLSETSAEFLYSTPEGLESAVVGLYNLQRDIWTDSEWNSAIPMIPVAKSDLTVGRTAEIAFYARLGWGADLNSFGTVRLSKHWRYGYRIVDRANAIINAASDVEMTEEKRNMILAEARVMRAQAYFTLYRQFKNIFITTEETTPGNAFDRPQTPSTDEEIFALINSDLDFAIDILPWTTNQFGRWTQASARHVRAKTAMWQEDWTEASEQADAVITQGSYSLVANTSEVFEGDMNHNESLLVLQFEDAAVGGGGFNRINFSLVPQYHVIDGATFSIDNGARGGGFLLMNNYFRNLLEEDPNDDRDNGNYYIMNYTYNDPSTLPEGVQLGDTIDVYNQFSEDNNERNLYYRTMNPSVIKYRQEDAPPSEPDHITNIMIYRLAETYLIGAEAHLNMGNQSKALEYINAVRTRAKAAPLNNVELIDIVEEQARELGFEGQRFYFLKRLGLLTEYVRDHASNEGFFDMARDRMEPHMINWPIPQDELELLGESYPQNPGY